MKRFSAAFIAFVLIFSLIVSDVTALTPSYDVSESYKSSIYYKQLTDIELTGNFIDDIVNVACSQIGYHESDNPDDLSGTAKGYSDYTEYCNWYGYNVGWCAVFISWCARQANIPESIIGNNSWADGKGGNFGETKVYSFGEHEPQKGDIVYVNNDSDSDADHVGIVYNVDDTFIYTVEGNTSQQVYDIKYYKDTGIQYYYSTTNIVYYGVPDYGIEETEEKTEPVAEPEKETEYLTGDVDGNGSVNSIDALLTLYCATELKLLSDDEKKRADLDNNGVINAIDALQILYIATQN